MSNKLVEGDDIMHQPQTLFRPFARRASLVCAAFGMSLQALATAYTWSTSVAKGDWTAPTSWTAGSGYPASSSDSAKFSSATATVNIDAAKTVGSVADTFQSSDVKFVGGKTLTISGNSWKIVKSSKVEASGSGTKVLFSGNGCKYVYGSNNCLRASDGGCIEVRGFKPGTAMWDLSTNLPTDMKVEAEGEGSLIDLRTDNNSEGIVGSGFTFSAKDGGEIQYGMGRSAQYCKNAIFKSKDAAVVLDDGSFVMGYTGFSMSTDFAGQKIELKGAEPLLSAATYVTIAGGGAAVSVKFIPEAGWAEFTAARIQSGTTATLGAGAAISIDGSAFGAVAGTKLIPLVSGKTSLSIADGVLSQATISGFPSGVTALLVTKDDDDTLAANTLYLKLVSNIRAVGVPVVAGATYDGQPHTAVVPTSDDYTVTTLPTDVVDAGDYDVVLTLIDPATTAWEDDGTSTPKTLKFTIAKAVNIWTTEPSLSKTTWAIDAEPATVSPGVPASLTAVVVTYDDDEIQMPTNVGSHTVYFNVAESKNHFALSKTIDYEVTKKVNSWATDPVVPKSFNIEDPVPAFVAPTAKYGEVTRYFDGDETKTEVPTDLGNHTVTYKVAEGTEHQGHEKTYSFSVTYKAIVDWQDASRVYGYRIPKLGDAQNEVALVFTNTAYTADDPMAYRLPQYVTEVSYLVVGGGAGGGGGKDGTAFGRGGGGAGGVLTGDVWTVSGDLSIVVGKGGAGMSSSAPAGWGGDGGMSLLANGETTIKAYGGGGGATGYAGKGGEGYGCGGGGSTKVISSQYVGQAGGEAGQGYAGGAGGNTTYLGGGGGGAGEAGYASTSEHPGHGGEGIASSITGEEKWYAGGGGGSKASNADPKVQSRGGKGGGGTGGYAASNQNGDGSDASYFGSGGGGGHKTARGGNGYQGVVVVRYVENATAVSVPYIAPKGYTGETLTADVPASDKYTVTANEGGTDVGNYPVTLTLVDGYRWDDGSTEPTNLVFAITQSQNEWTVEPSISKENWLTTDEPGVLTNGVTRFGEVTRVLVKNGALVAGWSGDLPTVAGDYVITNIAPETTSNYLAPDMTEKTVAFTIFSAAETPDFTVEFNGDVSVGVNENVVTAAIPYRVACDVESPKLVNVHALVTLKGAAETMDVTLAENVALDAAGFGALNDLKPGSAYDVALYGLGADDGKSSPTTDVVRVTTPGPATGLTASATFTNDPKEFILSGSVTPGLGTTTVYLRWSLNSDALDNLATYTFASGDAGAFSTNIAYTALSDTLTWDVAVSNKFTSTTYGDLSWNDALAATTKTRVDTVATTYTWTGASGDNFWTNGANWTADRTESYGYPDNKTYATAKFTGNAAVDMAGEKVGLPGSGLVLADGISVVISNGVMTGVSGAKLGAGNARLTFVDMTLEELGKLSIQDNATVSFVGKTALKGIVRPWGAKGASLVFKDGDVSISSYLSGYAGTGTSIMLNNAVVKVSSAPTSTWKATTVPLKFYGDSQLYVKTSWTLCQDCEMTIPSEGLTRACIQTGKCTATPGSLTYTVNVADYTSSRKVPLVRFTGEDQTSVMEGHGITLVAKARNKKTGALVDVTEKRKARLEWSSADNTLYYRQSGQLGFMIYLK